MPDEQDDSRSAIEIIAEFNERHSIRSRGDCLFIRMLKDHGLDDGQVAGVLDSLSNICQECFDNERGCQCWNDE